MSPEGPQEDPVPKKDEDKTLPPLEEWLAPWEKDEDGKKLEEPAEIDAPRLKKFLHGLLSDKFRLQEEKADLETAVGQKEHDLSELRQQHENDDQRRERESREREQHFAKLEAREKEREKVDALVEAFEDQGITPRQAKSLAKRIQGADEREWLADANDLVENGFRIGEKKAANAGETEETDDLSSSPRPALIRANGKPASETSKNRPKSPREELEAAGIFRDVW